MTGILLRKGEETGRIPCDDKGRGWNDDSTSQGMQSKHQKLERGKEGSFHGPIREIMAQLTPWFQTSSIQDCEQISVVFKPLDS